MEARVRLLSPEHRGKYDISIQENHRNEAKSEKRKFKKGRSCAWMQDIKSSKSIGDAAVVQSCLKKSRKGDVWEKMELCTKALDHSTLNRWVIRDTPGLVTNTSHSASEAMAPETVGKVDRQHCSKLSGSDYAVDGV